MSLVAWPQTIQSDRPSANHCAFQVMYLPDLDSLSSSPLPLAVIVWCCRNLRVYPSRRPRSSLSHCPSPLSRPD